ncbi:MAG: hypothetical protein HC794_06430 [Nitrospiraceae bacterium]|nr:hypothetical protein [Nitrospiraceae bacterium]
MITAGLQFGLTNYQVHTASETLSYNIRDRDTVQITGLFTRFLAPERNDMASNTYGVNVGGTHFFSENMTLTASGGPRFISNRISTGSRSLEDHSTVWVFNGKLTRRFERASVSLDIGRDIFPSGLGLLIRTDHLSANASYELADHLSIALTGQASIVNPVASSALLGLSRETRFFHLGPQINWRATKIGASRRGIPIRDASLREKTKAANPMPCGSW